MRNRFCILWLLVLGDVLYKAESSLRITFLEDLCYDSNKGTIDLRYDDSGILMSAPPSNSNNGFECEILLLPPKGSSVVLSIFRYDLHDDDQLIIEDSDRHRVALMGWGTFKDEKKSIVSDGRMTVLYKRRNTTSEYRRAGFQFTYTRAKNSPCQSDEFKCDNRKCVQRIYMCDGHNHCGDRSEQMKCSLDETDKTQVSEGASGVNKRAIFLSLIGVASVILLIVIIVFIVYMVKGAKLKKAAANSNTNASTRVAVPMQQVPSPVSRQPPQVPPTSTSIHGAQGNAFYNRVRRSLRESRPRQNAPEHMGTGSYQVPSMYPTLDPEHNAPEAYGVDNPDFRIEE